MSNRPNTATRSASARRVQAAATAGDTSRRPWWIVGIVVLVIAGAGLVALSAGESSERASSNIPTGGTIPGGDPVVPSSDAEFGTVAVSETPDLAPLQDPTDDPAVGQPAPTVTGTGLDGAELAVPTQGAPTLVMFVAHWCPHCQAEVPRIAEWLQAEGMPAGVELVTVATANDSAGTNFPAGEWLHEEGWPVPTMLDDEAGAAATAFGVSGFPYFAAVDADGTVVARASGEIGVEGVQDLIAQIARPEITEPEITEPETTEPETTGPETTGPPTTGPEPSAG
jgi:thiol-disulfide isomerase/thioredoxin